jgi:hypothetical protein
MLYGHDGRGSNPSVETREINARVLLGGFASRTANTLYPPAQRFHSHRTCACAPLLRDPLAARGCSGRPKRERADNVRRIGADRYFKRKLGLRGTYYYYYYYYYLLQWYDLNVILTDDPHLQCFTHFF